MIPASKIAGCIFLAVFATYGYLSGDIQLDFWSAEETFNARTFPRIIAAGGCLVTLVYLCTPTREHTEDFVAFNWGPALALLVLMSLYAWLLEPLGFVLATTGFLAAGYYLLGERRALVILAASLPVALGFAGIMALLDIYLARGVLVEAVMELFQ